MKKFVAVILKNNELSFGSMLNALGHATAGLVSKSFPEGDMQFVDYRDGDGNVYPSISVSPFIILEGKAGKLKTFREQLIQNDVVHTCFLDTMMHGGSDFQLETTLTKSEQELKFVCVAAFGEAVVLDPLTKKFSLWKT